MSAESQHIEYLELITKRLSGEIGPDEDLKLQNWLDQSPENQEVYHSYEGVWNEMDRVKDKTSREVDAEWQRLENAIDFEERVSEGTERRLFGGMYRYAASILFLAIAGFLIYYFINAGGTNELVAEVQIQSVELPEGSKVTVNSNTTLTYPKKFENNRREVALSGEAYFEVAEDPQRPFIINAGEVIVEVLGTSFNVKAYEDQDAIEVTVSTGKVAVYTPDTPDERVVLVQGEKAIFYRSNTRIEASLNDDINFASWKTKEIVFEDTAMPEVVRIINEIYKSDLKLVGDELLDCPVTTEFNDQSLEAVLNVLKSTLDLEINQIGSSIEISGKGC